MKKKLEIIDTPDGTIINIELFNIISFFLVGIFGVSGFFMALMVIIYDIPQGNVVTGMEVFNAVMTLIGGALFTVVNLYVVFGRERIVVKDRALKICYRLFGMGMDRVFDMDKISEFSVRKYSVINAIGIPYGRVSFVYDSKPVYFASLSAAEDVTLVINTLTSLMPSMALEEKELQKMTNEKSKLLKMIVIGSVFMVFLYFLCGIFSDVLRVDDKYSGITFGSIIMFVYLLTGMIGARDSEQYIVWRKVIILDGYVYVFLLVFLVLLLLKTEFLSVYAVKLLGQNNFMQEFMFLFSAEALLVVLPLVLAAEFVINRLIPPEKR